MRLLTFFVYSFLLFSGGFIYGLLVAMLIYQASRPYLEKNNVEQ